MLTWKQTPRKNVQLVIRPGENAAYDMMLLRYKRKVELFVTMRVVWAFIELFQGKMSFWRSFPSCNLKHFHFVFALPYHFEQEPALNYFSVNCFLF